MKVSPCCTTLKICFIIFCSFKNVIINFSATLVVRITAAKVGRKDGGTLESYLMASYKKRHPDVGMPLYKGKNRIF